MTGSRGGRTRRAGGPERGKAYGRLRDGGSDRYQGEQGREDLAPFQFIPPRKSNLVPIAEAQADMIDLDILRDDLIDVEDIAVQVAEVHTAWRNGPTGFGSEEPPHDACLVEIVGRHLHADAIARGDADPALAHFARDGGEHDVLVREFDAEHRPGQDGLNPTFDLDVLFSIGLHLEKNRRERMRSADPTQRAGKIGQSGTPHLCPS